VVRWLRTEARKGHAPRRWARWIGRNWARVSYGYGVEPTWLEVNHHEVPVRDLRPPFAGYRIVQLSDLHCSRHVTTASLHEAVALRRAEATLHLVGVADLWSRVCDLQQAFAGLDASQPHVVLAHNPRTIEQLDGRRCDLMLSGHTHGGQIHVPGLGRPTLGRRARRFAAGLYQFRGAHLYVNKGVGFGFRFRYGVRPEVAVLSLQPA